ncbi:MAG: site-2 protease family protein [Syntrophomonadaceae bacterium]
MKGSFALGSIRGIQIKSDFGCVLVLGSFGAMLAALYFPLAHPGWDPYIRWTVGMVIALVLFISVLVHELSHSLVSCRFGLQVERISLFIFGGKTQIAGLPARPAVDLQMALSGPAVSLLLYLLLLLSAKILGWLGVSEAVTMACFYSAQVNIILVLFNIVPIFPLDGGRVLRAIVWHVKGDFHSATRLAAATGNGFGWLMILAGLYLILAGDYLLAIWFAFNGWYIRRLALSGH